jgi:hypothetical protein
LLKYGAKNTSGNLEGRIGKIHKREFCKDYIQAKGN